MRSRMASATVGSPTMSYQLEEGYCEVMMMDLRSWRSSMMSSNIGRSFASSGTRKRSSRMSSWQRSIFLSSVSRLFLTFATLSSPSSLEALAYKVRMPFLQASCPRAQARKLLPVPEEPVMKRFWRVKFNREVRQGI